MACNCNQRPALTAVTVADQTVVAEGFLDFNTNSVRNGCSVVHVAGSNSITLASDGLYLVTFNGNVTPAAAGDITLQLIRTALLFRVLRLLLQVRRQIFIISVLAR